MPPDRRWLSKTVIFSYIAEQTALRNKNVLILAHRDFLLGQISLALADNDVKHNLICQKSLSSILYMEHLKMFGALYLDKNSHVTVASIQTLIRRDYATLLKDIDLIIIDEAHRSAAQSYVDVLNARPSRCKVLGVTATPERTDGTGLNLIYEDLIIGSSVKELIKLQKICYPLVYGSEIKLDLSGIKTTAGDYDNKQLFERVGQNKKLVGDAIAHYKNISGVVPAMGFCINVAHSEITAEEFKASGIRAIALSAKNNTAERNQATYKLKNGELDIIFSCDLFNEGYDVGTVAAGIMLRPTQSTIIYRQQIGRILRRYPDDSLLGDKFIKPNGDHIAYIFDHAGNTEKHGLPTDDKEWTLEGKKRKAKDKTETKVSQCPNCYAYHSAGATKCPHCPHVYHVQKRELEIEVVEGSLKALNEYSPDWAMGVNIKTATTNEILRYARTEEQLLEVAKVLGRKPGWAYYVMKAREKKNERK